MPLNTHTANDSLVRVEGDEASTPDWSVFCSTLIPYWLHFDSISAPYWHHIDSRLTHIDFIYWLHIYSTVTSYKKPKPKPPSPKYLVYTEIRIIAFPCCLCINYMYIVLVHIFLIPIPQSTLCCSLSNKNKLSWGVRVVLIMGFPCMLTLCSHCANRVISSFCCQRWRRFAWTMKANDWLWHKMCGSFLV